MGFAVMLVGLSTITRGWGMHHWRNQGPVRHPYSAWVIEVQTITGLVHNSSSAHAIEHAIFGSCGVILSPSGTNVQGKVLAISGFQVFSDRIVFLIFLTFLLPMWSLSFSIEAIGGERESQSLIWLLSRPLSRPAIYLAKFVAMLPWSIGLNVGGFALLCLVGGAAGRRALVLYWPAVLASSLTFTTLFLLVGAYFRRPAVVAIIYSFCLEVVLGNMPGYLKRLSIGYYARCLMFERAEQFGIQPDKPGVFLPVDGTTALLVLLSGALLFLLAGMWFFSRKEYHEVD
jgi:ABC-type transport system involved in multi-copper enzyme maturation permease subunit